MKIKFIAVCVMSLCLLTSLYAHEIPEKRIYLVDMSGSMAGKGTVETADIMQKVKTALLNTISWVPVDASFVIIPFTDRLYPEIPGSTEDKTALKDKVSTMVELEGNTDLMQPWKAGLLQLDSAKVNYLFLITDGLHNCGAAKEQVVKMLSEWPEVSDDYNAEAYYVAMDSSYRKSYICSIFDSQERMHVVESMNVLRNYDESENAVDSLAVQNYADEEDVKDCKEAICLGWLWILLALAILALVIYCLVKYGPVLFKRLPKYKKNTPVGENKLPGTKNDDDDDWRMRVKRKTHWGDEIIYSLNSEEEANIYINAGLKESIVGNRTALIQPKIDPDMKTPKWYLKEHPQWEGWTNADLAGEGYAPFSSPIIPGTEEGTDPFELHHIGQRPNSPLAELTYSQHHDEGIFSILHKFAESQIDRTLFEKERSQYWQDRYKATWSGK